MTVLVFLKVCESIDLCSAVVVRSRYHPHAAGSTPALRIQQKTRSNSRASGAYTAPMFSLHAI